MFLFVVVEILWGVCLEMSCWNEILLNKKGILELIKEEFWSLKLGVLGMRLFGVGEGWRVIDFFSFEL